MGIKSLLADASSIKVIGEASTGEEAISFLRDKTPDVILLDVQMPGMGGLEATRRILRMRPDMRIIIVTAVHDDPYPSRIMQAGASGYLTKECNLDEMVDAIEKVFHGERYISPQIAQKLAIKSVAADGSDVYPLDDLSERELQVMIMITSGANVHDVSEKLHLSAKTINSYRYRLFKKLQVTNDVELTHYALRHGLIEKSSLLDENDKTEK